MAKPSSNRPGAAQRRQSGKRGGSSGISAKALWGVVGVAIVAVAALIYIGTRPSSSGPAVPAEVLTQGTSKGDVNAPVTLVEYSDFQ